MAITNPFRKWAQKWTSNGSRRTLERLPSIPGMEVLTRAWQRRSSAAPDGGQLESADQIGNSRQNTGTQVAHTITCARLPQAAHRIGSSFDEPQEPTVSQDGDLHWDFIHRSRSFKNTLRIDVNPSSPLARPAILHGGTISLTHGPSFEFASVCHPLRLRDALSSTGSLIYCPSQPDEWAASCSPPHRPLAPVSRGCLHIGLAPAPPRSL